MPALHASQRLTQRRPQRGAATLIVVMVLFFVMSLAAAYASRNLIFEQRTSANQLRSTQSFDAAEAGLEWAVAMLNSGRIDENCEPTTDTSKNSFRQRYLTASSSPTPPGAIRPVLQSDGAVLWVACTLDGNAWRCVCPTTALGATALPVSGPAFALRFVGQINMPGMVRIEVNGCNSFELACVQAGILSLSTCQSTLCSLVALHSGAKMPPAAAITAVTGIDGTALRAVNTSRAAGGVTLHTDGAVTVSSITLISLPGRPGSQSVRAGAGSFGTLDAHSDSCTFCLFTSVFGLRPATYREQGAAIQIDCATACSASAVNTALDSARSRIVVLRNAGGLTINAGTDIIGSTNDPVVLVVEGPLTIDAAAGSAARIHGLVYAASATIGAGEIHGALVSRSTVTASGTAEVVYDEDVLTKLQLTSGSFVRVPGAWRDFQ